MILRLKTTASHRDILSPRLPLAFFSFLFLFHSLRRESLSKRIQIYDARYRNHYDSHNIIS